MSETRLAIVATHPVQYQVPWIRELARTPGWHVRVFYALLPDAAQQGVGFGVPFTWDLPLLDGYEWEALPNTARQPSLETFAGTNTPSVGRALEAFDPAAVIITGWHARPMLQALAACVRRRIPRLVRGESNSLRPRPAWVRAIHRVLLGRYQAFLAIGRANRDFYVLNGVAPERIFPAPYFVENRRFAEQAAALAARRAELRASWGIPEDAACFLFSGKLIPKKRPLDLVRALGIARRGGARAHLLVAGDGALMPDLKDAAQAEGVPATFAGFLNQTEIARAYAAADCLVLPSDHGETWGLVVNEAMACGLPAVVSDQVGCGPDLVEPGVTGEVVRCGDVRALAACLGTLAADPAGLRRMGEAARARVEAYSPEAAAEGTRSAVEYVLRRSRRGAAAAVPS